MSAFAVGQHVRLTPEGAEELARHGMDLSPDAVGVILKLTGSSAKATAAEVGFPNGFHIGIALRFLRDSFTGQGAGATVLTGEALPMDDHRSIICSESADDAGFLDRFLKEVEMLAGMSVEMMVEHRTTVLSPTFRAMLAEKAQSVQAYLGPLKGRLHVDNPGKALVLWPPKGMGA